MKRPSFQFYPADWRHNAKLRRCSEAARGAWMDVLCVLHDSDEYGVCRWPLADLARASGVALRSVKELVEKGVLKGADRQAEAFIYTPQHAGMKGTPVVLVETAGQRSGPCWYSSRMVRDEWVRQRRGHSTRFTENNKQNPRSSQPKNHAPQSQKRTAAKSPKVHLGERLGDGPTSSSSSSSTPSSFIFSSNEEKKLPTIATLLSGAVPALPATPWPPAQGASAAAKIGTDIRTHAGHQAAVISAGMDWHPRLTSKFTDVLPARFHHATTLQEELAETETPIVNRLAAFAERRWGSATLKTAPPVDEPAVKNASAKSMPAPGMVPKTKVDTVAPSATGEASHSIPVPRAAEEAITPGELTELQAIFPHADVSLEWKKCRVWCANRRITPQRKLLENWLKRIPEASSSPGIKPLPAASFRSGKDRAHAANLHPERQSEEGLVLGWGHRYQH